MWPDVEALLAGRAKPARSDPGPKGLGKNRDRPSPYVRPENVKENPKTKGLGKGRDKGGKNTKDQGKTKRGMFKHWDPTWNSKDQKGVNICARHHGPDGCNKEGCTFSHVCPICFGDHKASQCKKR